MTNPMTMIERVARAIYEDRNGSGCVPWARRGSELQNPYRSDACAAIKAMIGPSALMIAAAQTTRGDDLEPTDMELVGFYNAMVHVALSEHQTETRKG